MHQSVTSAGSGGGVLEFEDQAAAYAKMEKIQNDTGDEVPGFHLRRYKSDGSYDELWIIDLDGQVTGGHCIWREAVIREYCKNGYQLNGLTHTHPDDTYASTTDMFSLRSWADENGGSLNLDVITNGKV